LPDYNGVVAIPHVSKRPAVWVCLALCLSLMAVLAACDPGAPPPATPLPAGEPKVEVAQGAGAQAAPASPALAAPTPTPVPVSGRLVLWHSWAGADGDALAEILANFQREYPGVTVDTLFVAYPDLAQGYADAVNGRGGPDLVLAPTWWISDFVDIGVVQPLDALVTPAELDAYWPAAVDNLRWRGQVYGLPTNFELVSLFVNKALAGAGGAPKTTADLLAQAQAAPTQGVGLYDNLYHLFWGIPAYGGRLFDKNGDVVLDQGGDTAGYLAWLRAIAQSAGSYVDSDYGMLLDRFKKGEFAYFVDGPWSIGDLTTALGDNLAVAPLPAGPAGAAGPWLHADGAFVNPRVAPEQQTLALLFARYLTSADSGAVLARVANRLPGNRSASIGDNTLLQGFMDQAATAQSMPNIPEMQQVWGYGGDMVIKVVAGDADPVATVKQTAALINEANGK